jgi:hypothetical protein
MKQPDKCAKRREKSGGVSGKRIAGDLTFLTGFHKLEQVQHEIKNESPVCRLLSAWQELFPVKPIVSGASTPHNYVWTIQEEAKGSGAGLRHHLYC